MTAPLRKRSTGLVTWQNCVWRPLQVKAEESVAALERENVVLRVQASDSVKRAEELQQQLSACQVTPPPPSCSSCRHAQVMLRTALYIAQRVSRASVVGYMHGSEVRVESLEGANP